MKKKDLHIGNLVARVCKERGYAYSEVAAKIGISRQKFNGWLKNDNWSVKDLFTVSEVIGYDFVALFNQADESAKNTKILLQFEIDESKAREILNIVNFNEQSINKPSN
jgi:transcriptional regulator with XRE-family HTH domain